MMKSGSEDGGAYRRKFMEVSADEHSTFEIIHALYNCWICKDNGTGMMLLDLKNAKATEHK